MLGKLGMDLGGVICDRVKPDGQMVKDFLTDYRDVTEVDRSFWAIQKLVERLGKDNCFIVSSNMSAITELASRYWLTFRNFCGNTGFNPDHIFFCRGRELKAPICQELGITHFIDDRPQVLQALVGAVPSLYWFKPREQDLKDFPNLRLPAVTLCYSWQEIMDTLLSDWNDFHQGAFTTEIIGCEVWGVVCGDETFISAARKAYECAFHRKLSLIEIAHLPDRLTIVNFFTDRNLLRLAVRE